MKINYTAARNAAKLIDNVGGSAGDVSRSVQKANAGVPAYWAGRSADAFMEVLRNWCAETAKISQECTTLAALIRQTADDFERQELNAAAAAAVRGAAGVSPIGAAAVKGVAAAAAWKGK